MDPGQIGNTLLALVIGVGSIGTWLSTGARKTRARNRQFTRDLMAYEQWVSDSIRSRHQHNITVHAADPPERFIEIPPLPDPMTREDTED